MLLPYPPFFFTYLYFYPHLNQVNLPFCTASTRVSSAWQRGRNGVGGTLSALYKGNEAITQPECFLCKKVSELLRPYFSCKELNSQLGL
jgi:hypothetical protein